MAFTATGRPSVWQVFCALPPIEATRVCARLGYTHAEIAAVAQVSRSAISYRLRAAAGIHVECLARGGELLNFRHIDPYFGRLPDITILVIEEPAVLTAPTGHRGSRCRSSWRSMTTRWTDTTSVSGLYGLGMATSTDTGPSRPEERWFPARIIPTSGIGGGPEQERRATSALLAVMKAVPAFGAALTSKVGAPRGNISTFVEIRLANPDGQNLIPDGAIVIEGRGGATWRCLVEVKTAENDLLPAQVDAYLDLAKAYRFDAVLTISNQITGSSDESPVALPSKGRGRAPVRPPLYHLSWWQILTEAIVHHQHRGISDPDQAWILGELIAYLDNERSGAGGFVEMGERWVKVRDAARERTLKASDPEAGNVAERFEQFVDYLCLGLYQDLGRQVVPLFRRGIAPTDRWLQAAKTLADDGRLESTIRITDAVGPVVVDADLRGRVVTTSVLVDAPREDGQRAKTRIGWMLRQLSSAPAGLRVEVLFEATRGQTTSLSLSEAIENPDRLLFPQDPKRLPRAFRLALAREMGTKRGKVPGSFIYDTKRQVVDFYRDVVQGLVAWQPRAPKLPAAGLVGAVEHPTSEPPPFSAPESREAGEASDPDEASGNFSHQIDNGSEGPTLGGDGVFPPNP